MRMAEVEPYGPVDDASKCLVYNDGFGQLFFVPNRSQLIQERQQIIRGMDKKVTDFDMESIWNQSTSFTSKNSIYELQAMTQRLAYLNERLNSHPVSPPNPTIHDAELLASEKNFLIRHSLSLEQEIQNFEQYVTILDQTIGPAGRPTSMTTRMQSLIAERNLRIKVICNAKRFFSNLWAKKAALTRQRTRLEVSNGLPEDYRSKHTYIERSINEALNNYQNLINANRFGLSMIDQEIAQLDPPFHHWLSQIDEETHHLFGKREMLAKKQLESEVLLLKTKNRIAFINAKFKEFLMFENKDFQKINSFLKMSLGLDDDGLLATALEYDNPDLPKIEP